MTTSKIPALAALVSAVLASSLASADAGGPTLDLPPGEEDRGRDAGPPAVTIGGYGELHYTHNRPESGPTRSEIDMHRMVLYVGRRFNERISFQSEIEVEHAISGDGQVGEVAVEQALIDYRLREAGQTLGIMGIRAGIMLVPMGIINRQHEPPAFNGVERPSVDKLIIPSTWREGGMAFYHQPSESLRYEVMVIGGLDPTKFSSNSGLRGGRQKVGEARTDGLAFAGRIDYQPTTKATLGFSAYYNQSGKNSDLISAKVPVLGLSADARAKIAGLEARAVFAMFKIGDTAKLNALTGPDGNALMHAPDTIWGGYGELAYDVLRGIDGQEQLLPFTRVEYYETDPEDPSKSAMDIVMGLTFRPVPQVAFKGDVAYRRKGGDIAGDNSTRLNLGIGFLY